MFTTVEGVYEGGSIVLREKPPGIARARVLVTFVPESEVAAAEPSELRRPLEGWEEFIATLPPVPDLPDEAFDRGSIYTR